MKDYSKSVGLPTAGDNDTLAVPAVVDRAVWQSELDALRVKSTS
jgi:hypothetical protein